MKTYVQNLTMLSAVIAFGCQSNKTETPVEEPQAPTVTASDTTAAATPGESMQSKTIDGIVKYTSHGKDGFTAAIETNDGTVYQATISRANLKDPKQYRDFNTNELVKLTGDSWKMGQDNQLTVRVIN